MSWRERKKLRMNGREGGARMWEGQPAGRNNQLTLNGLTSTRVGNNVVECKAKTAKTVKVNERRKSTLE